MDLGESAYREQIVNRIRSVYSVPSQDYLTFEINKTDRETSTYKYLDGLNPIPLELEMVRKTPVYVQILVQSMSKAISTACDMDSAPSIFFCCIF